MTSATVSADRRAPGPRQVKMEWRGISTERKPSGTTWRSGWAGAEVRVVVDHSSREIVFYVDADGEHPSHRPLQLSFEVIADQGTRQLAESLDSLNVIERMRAAGSELVIVSKGLA